MSLLTLWSLIKGKDGVRSNVETGAGLIVAALGIYVAGRLGYHLTVEQMGGAALGCVLVSNQLLGNVAWVKRVDSQLSPPTTTEQKDPPCI
jgi:hypothetical protein